MPRRKKNVTEEAPIADPVVDQEQEPEAGEQKQEPKTRSTKGFDSSKPHATVIGPTRGKARFVQAGVYYGADGEEVPAP